MISSPERLLLLPLLALLLQLVIYRAQQLPDNPCPTYFQYVHGSRGLGNFQGELTLSLLTGRNRIDVRFSQRGEADVRSRRLSLTLSLHSSTYSISQPRAVGSVRPYPDERTVRRYYERLDGKFRIDLWPDKSGLLPKLTRLVYNNATLCSLSDCE